MRIYVSKYDLISNKIDDIVIAHISDIHYDVKYNLKRFDILVDEISKIKPDYICITGDVLDTNLVFDKKDVYNYLVCFVNRLCMISKVIITLGNHEMYGKTTNYKKIINDLKVNTAAIILDNELYKDGNICFIGFNPTEEYYNKRTKKLLIRDVNNLKFKIEKNKYNILLIHTPKDILSKKIYSNTEIVKNSDLILAGHTHGGMVPLNVFGHMGLIAPEKTLFPINVRGHLKKDKTDLIICSGIVRLSNSAHFFKYFNDLYSMHINSINIVKSKK